MTYSVKYQSVTAGAAPLSCFYHVNTRPARGDLPVVRLVNAHSCRKQ